MNGRNKIAFEMTEEERVLHVLDTTIDFGIASFSEGIEGMKMDREDADKLVDLLINANQIICKEIDKYQREVEV